MITEIPKEQLAQVLAVQRRLLGPIGHEVWGLLCEPEQMTLDQFAAFEHLLGLLKPAAVYVTAEAPGWKQLMLGGKRGDVWETIIWSVGKTDPKDTIFVRHDDIRMIKGMLDGLIVATKTYVTQVIHDRMYAIGPTGGLSTVASQHQNFEPPNHANCRCTPGQ